MKEKYEDYSWIKVKRHQDDESLSWEERFKLLLSHHEKETTFLIREIRKLADEYDKAVGVANVSNESTPGGSVHTSD